ncbi:hypothetical protein MSAN_02029900 [Mycena sanguinolenta]|uniref:Uncharacterized protein n=1 Tax=Mycena sanguinolenta TaxID=230812 RepID=A0A8H6XJH8_9AGAR|nr:hypothetical protein MSAN_02029900 [Mycena sanguinolenta]
MLKNNGCKKAQASLTAPKQQSKLSSFFGKRQPYAEPTVPPIAKPTQSMFSGYADPSSPHFRRRVEQLHGRVPEADSSHPFARFRNYEGSVPAGESAWEVWDRPIGNAVPLSQEELRPLIASGANGVMAIYELMLWLATTHKTTLSVMEPKIDRLMEAMNTFLDTTPMQKDTEPAFNSRLPSPAYSPPPIDSILTRIPGCYQHRFAVSIATTTKAHRISPNTSMRRTRGRISAWGFCLGRSFDAGKCGHFRIVVGRMSKKKMVFAFYVTLSNLHPQFKSVQHHILYPPKTQTNLAYYTTDGLVVKAREQQRTIKALRLVRINDGRKIASRTRALTLHKQWVIAVASEKVLRVDRLAATQLNHKAGIGGLLNRYIDAAKHVFKPLNYTEEDYMRGLLIWRLAGARLAGIAQRSLDLPSISTLRRHSIVPNLIASATTPDCEEIKTNFRACFAEIDERIRVDGISTRF